MAIDPPYRFDPFQNLVNVHWLQATSTGRWERLTYLSLLNSWQAAPLSNPGLTPPDDPLPNDMDHLNWWTYQEPMLPPWDAVIAAGYCQDQNFGDYFGTSGSVYKGYQYTGPTYYQDTFCYSENPWGKSLEKPVFCPITDYIAPGIVCVYGPLQYWSMPGTMPDGTPMCRDHPGGFFASQIFYEWRMVV